MSWGTLTSSQFNQLLHECAYTYTELTAPHGNILKLSYRVIQNESIAIDPSKRRYLPSTDLQALVCTGVDTVTAFVLGPFYLSPGDWLNVYGYFKLDPGGVISYSSDVIYNDLASTVPPSLIHMHHVHIKEPDDRSGHRFETHGDYYGIHGDGYSMTLPWGYCTVHDVPAWYAISSSRPTKTWPDSIKGALMMDALANVMTVDATKLLNETLYFRLAFQTVESNRCSRVDKMMLMPFMMGLNDPLTRFVVQTPSRVAYWWNGRFPRSGKVVAMWRHSHRQRDGGMLLYMGQLSPMASSNLSTDPSITNIERAIQDVHRVRPVARTQHDTVGQFEWNSTLSVSYGMHYTTIAVFNDTDSNQIHHSHTIIFLHYVPTKRRERLQYVDGGNGGVLVDGTVHESTDQRSLMNDASFCCRHWRLEWSNASARFEWNARGAVRAGRQNCPLSLDSIRESCISNDR